MLNAKSVNELTQNLSQGLITQELSLKSLLYSHKTLKSIYPNNSYQYHLSKLIALLTISWSLILYLQTSLTSSISTIQSLLRVFTLNWCFQTFPITSLLLLLFTLNSTLLSHKAKICTLSYWGKLYIVFMHRLSKREQFRGLRSWKWEGGSKLLGRRRLRGSEWLFMRGLYRSDLGIRRLRKLHRSSIWIEWNKLALRRGGPNSLVQVLHALILLLNSMWTHLPYLQNFTCLKVSANFHLLHWTLLQAANK